MNRLRALVAGGWLVATSGLAAVAGGQAAPAEAAPGADSEPGLARLEREVVRLAAQVTGTVGVAAVHLESGRAVYLNADEPFPMASTYKVPIAVVLLRRVERGEVSLDEMIELRPGDLHPGSGTLTPLFDDPGVILSLRNLLELTLLISDNSATDLTLARAGGAAAVTAALRELGLEGMRVDRPTLRLIGDYLGVSGLPDDDQVTPEQFAGLTAGLDGAAREAARHDFDRDPRDTSTPRAMAQLLIGVWERRLLGEEQAALLLDIMRRSTTGAGRIRGLLTPDIEVAHKTGTIGGTTNDVGIVTLPEEAGHVAIVVFVKESEAEIDEREQVIADIARAVHDYFLFVPNG